MKIIISVVLFLLTLNVFGGTCTSISRTNSSALSVLTSSKYNLDHNTAYSAINSFDGGCVQSGTLEFDALNTSQFAPILSGEGGCKVSYSSVSTLSIGKCRIAVNGNLVNTTSTTNASFGCSGCSSEVASTGYYLYIQTGSSGTTITPLISTTAPNEDGYDNSNNRVLARFWNNGAGDIDQYSIDQWRINRFDPQNTGWVSCGLAAANFIGFGTVTNINVSCKRQGSDLLMRGYYSTGTPTANIAAIVLTMGGPLFTASSLIAGVQIAGTWQRNTVNGNGLMVIDATTSALIYPTAAISTINGLVKITGSSLAGTTEIHSFTARVPISGWGE